MATEYTAIFEDIASHGYVVVAINPTDFVPVTAFENGHTVHAPVWDISLYDLENDLGSGLRVQDKPVVPQRSLLTRPIVI